ncbi:hypothetical protein VC83_03307 [Pseudogymnoascus destructans]|uniref:Uncharacterized protein n=1 Tax=Pseudogymnoascus destructans TaxID=655981 RepID=A0A177AEV0_9PEZI|nr:uncharacterized protein VC83_03307 [Pseudogymnoascus destructans]OAF60635.1 hypothetical protein VC83_03307 [Pseudogymnoascus destructans]
MSGGGDGVYQRETRMNKGVMLDLREGEGEKETYRWLGSCVGDCTYRIEVNDRSRGRHGRDELHSVFYAGELAFWRIPNASMRLSAYPFSSLLQSCSLTCPSIHPCVQPQFAS